MIGFASRKGAMDRARAEIAGLEVALESYKADNGDYPRSSDPPNFTNNVAEALDATNPGNPGTGASPTATYAAASLALYIGLTGNSALDGVTRDTDASTGQKAKVYFTFKASMLYPKATDGAARTIKIQSVIDPFGNLYGYSTLGSSQTGGGYNPTFDLWSTVDGHPGDPATWIKNW